MGVRLEFAPGHEPDENTLKSTIVEWGYMVAEGSLNISSNGQVITWNFVMVALRSRPDPSSLFDLSRNLRALKGIGGLQITHARN
jgi:hypothetical protein